MQELNYVDESIVLNQKDEVISFKCELQENLQNAMKEFVEEHPNWYPVLIPIRMLLNEFFHSLLKIFLKFTFETYYFIFMI